VKGTNKVKRKKERKKEKKEESKMGRQEKTGYIHSS
jgi:hypothetical protein